MYDLCIFVTGKAQRIDLALTLTISESILLEVFECFYRPGYYCSLRYNPDKLISWPLSLKTPRCAFWWSEFHALTALAL
jgi:hypothetical protein